MSGGRLQLAQADQQVGEIVVGAQVVGILRQRAFDIGRSRVAACRESASDIGQDHARAYPVVVDGAGSPSEPRLLSREPPER